MRASSASMRARAVRRTRATSARRNARFRSANADTNTDQAQPEPPPEEEAGSGVGRRTSRDEPYREREGGQDAVRPAEASAEEKRRMDERIHCPWPYQLGLDTGKKPNESRREAG